ncbi:MAG: hypothetical protein QHH09_00350 [Microgenomates group bacterium]|nr:hypothetical protein [Microgenomates group bacterium]
MEKSKSNSNLLEKDSLALTSVVVLLVFLLLVGGVYFWVSKKNKGNVVFPAGVSYLGPNQLTPVPTVDLTQLGKSGKWLQSGGKIYKYLFIYPAELQITAFINDQSDKIAWITGIVPPQQNIAFTVETISEFNKKYQGDLEGFAANYWRRFSGLSGAKSVEPYTNSKGLKGFKAIYLDKKGNVANTNYFFQVPNDPDHVLQVINGMIPENIFNQIVNSVEFK